MSSVELLLAASQADKTGEGAEKLEPVGGAAVAGHAVDEVLEPEGKAVHGGVAGELGLEGDAAVLIVKVSMVTKAEEGVQGHVTDEVGPGDVGDQRGKGHGGDHGEEEEKPVALLKEQQGVEPVVDADNVGGQLGHDEVGEGLDEGGEVHEGERVGADVSGRVVPRGVWLLEGEPEEGGDEPEEVAGDGGGDAPEDALLSEAVEDVEGGEDGDKHKAGGEGEGLREGRGELELAEEADGEADVARDGEVVDVLGDPALVGQVKREQLVQDAEEVRLHGGDDQPPVEEHVHQRPVQAVIRAVIDTAGKLVLAINQRMCVRFKRSMIWVLVLTNCFRTAQINSNNNDSQLRIQDCPVLNSHYSSESGSLSSILEKPLHCGNWKKRKKKREKLGVFVYTYWNLGFLVKVCCWKYILEE